jgi:hypothetical protein
VLPLRRATTNAAPAGTPQEKVPAEERTTGAPVRPAAIGSVAAAVMLNWVCDPAVPKSVPDVVPVRPISSKSADSQTSTGTATLLNFELTFAEVTVDEMTTSCFPVASAALAAESWRTVTANPSAVSRC